jgi:hypothetical protein
MRHGNPIPGTSLLAKEKFIERGTFELLLGAAAAEVVFARISVAFEWRALGN